MRIIGILLIIVVAFSFPYDRIKKAQRSLLILEELYRFIECARVEIGCYLRPITEIPKSFSSEILDSFGFLTDAEALGLFSAYMRLEKRIDATEDEKKTLRHFFSHAGRGYLEDEIKLIDSTASQLSAAIEKKRADAPKHKKLLVTLCSAAASALIILLI